MSDIGGKVLSRVRERLNEEVLIKIEIDNPHLDKYLDIIIEVMIKEIFKAIKEKDDEFCRQLGVSARRL